MVALRRLAGFLRATGFRNEVEDAGHTGWAAGRLALGHPVRRADLPGPMGGRDADALIAAGAAVEEGGRLVASFHLFAGPRRLLILVPKHDPDDAHRVYLGRDTLWLLDLVLAVAPPGRAAAELGTGPGLLLPVLAGHYELVAATDLLPSAAAVARINIVLNCSAERARRVAVCVGDVAGGLRPDTFSLVAANPPWVPDSPGTHQQRVFEEGGPSGFELPSRFITEGASLLRTGGVLVALAIDVLHHDGRQPLREVLASLGEASFATELIPTPADASWPWLRPDRFGDGVRSLRHVGVVVRRLGPVTASWAAPPPGPAGPAAQPGERR